jgi:hypothetical protein
MPDSSGLGHRNSPCRFLPLRHCGASLGQSDGAPLAVDHSCGKLSPITVCVVDALNAISSDPLRAACHRC